MRGPERRGLGSVRRRSFPSWRRACCLGGCRYPSSYVRSNWLGPGIDGIPGRQPVASRLASEAAKCVTERKGLKRASPADLIGCGLRTDAAGDAPDCSDLCWPAGVLGAPCAGQVRAGSFAGSPPCPRSPAASPPPGASRARPLRRPPERLRLQDRQISPQLVRLGVPLHITHENLRQRHPQLRVLRPQPCVLRGWRSGPGTIRGDGALKSGTTSCMVRLTRLSQPAIKIVFLELVHPFRACQ